MEAVDTCSLNLWHSIYTQTELQDRGVSYSSFRQQPMAWLRMLGRDASRALRDGDRQAKAITLRLVHSKVE